MINSYMAAVPAVESSDFELTKEEMAFIRRLRSMDAEVVRVLQRVAAEYDIKLPQLSVVGSPRRIR